VFELVDQAIQGRKRDLGWRRRCVLLFAPLLLGKLLSTSTPPRHESLELLEPVQHHVDVF
jgi:hypothetical protein